MNTNYRQLYTKFTKGLSPKVKDIFDRRFGVGDKFPETLESIGDSLGITRERVRQIEEAGFNHVRKHNKEALDIIHADLEKYFNASGGFKKEEVVLKELGGKSQKPYILFLLTIGEQFSKIAEKKDYHYFWSNLPNAKETIKANLTSLVSSFQKIGKPISQKEFFSQVAFKNGFSEKVATSYLEISKRIQSGVDGADNILGLVEWPEINPRGVKDKAFLALKKYGKPLHFTKVAKMIDEYNYNLPNKQTYPQTVHNELIKDARFVLVGRGTYALAEWGYQPGTIKEVIARVLENNNGPMHKDEVVNKVMSQRLVAKNTVLMNLNNKNNFEKDSKDRYFFTKTQTV